MREDGVTVFKLGEQSLRITCNYGDTAHGYWRTH